MAARPNVGPGNKNNGLIEVRPRTITLPEVEETFRAEATPELKLSIFFNVWDNALKTDLANLAEQPGSTFTIITVDDESFLDLAEKSGSTKREFPDQELLNRFILANQVVGEKIEPDTLTEEPLRVKTVGGFSVKVSKKEGQIYVDDVKVKAMKASSQGIILVVEEPFNIPVPVVEKALERIQAQAE